MPLIIRNTLQGGLRRTGAGDAIVDDVFCFEACLSTQQVLEDILSSIYLLLIADSSTHHLFWLQMFGSVGKEVTKSSYVHLLHQNNKVMVL